MSPEGYIRSSAYNQPVFRHVQGLKDPEDVTINCNTHFTRLIHLGHILSLCVNFETDCDVPFFGEERRFKQTPAPSCWTLVTVRIL